MKGRVRREGRKMKRKRRITEKRIVYFSSVKKRTERRVTRAIFKTPVCKRKV